MFLTKICSNKNPKINLNKKSLTHGDETNRIEHSIDFDSTQSHEAKST